ncbi:hypothetical protein HOD61_00170 [archaeon]|jgi:hypothetical protein|nr:hypothetical protein [archaeon]
MERKQKQKQNSKLKDYFVSALIGTTLGLTLSFSPNIIKNINSKPNLEKVQTIASEVNYEINDYFLPNNKKPELILIGDIHGSTNTQISKILNKLVSNNDEVLIECPTNQTTLESVIEREYLRPLFEGKKLTNISIEGTDDSLLVEQSLEVVEIMDYSNYLGIKKLSRLATNYLISIAYERDRFSFSPKIIESIEKNRIKNNSIRNLLGLSASSESYQIIGSLHLEMDEIRKNLKKEGVSYISLIPNFELEKDSVLSQERRINAQKIYDKSRGYFNQSKGL